MRSVVDSMDVTTASANWTAGSVAGCGGVSDPREVDEECEVDQYGSHQADVAGISSSPRNTSLVLFLKFGMITSHSRLSLNSTALTSGVLASLT